MRIAIVTALRRSTASRCLPILLASSKIEIARVILIERSTDYNWKTVCRKFRKLRSIGILGALNGVRMRPWFDSGDVEDVEELCSKLGVEFSLTSRTNCEKTSRLLSDSEAELGLSLGNGYLARSVFSVPRFGMINVHGEILPRFPGAQSVIWAIHEGCPVTGFTIHQINSKIDRGTILHQESWPIRYQASLLGTVKANLALLNERLPHAVSFVCENYGSLRNGIHSDGSYGRSYTTPSFREFCKMQRMNKRNYRKSRE